MTTIPRSKKQAIINERLSKHDQKVINEYFTWLDSDAKKRIAKKYNVSVAYVNMILAGTRIRKDIYNHSIGVAMKMKQAHLNLIRELKKS